MIGLVKPQGSSPDCTPGDFRSSGVLFARPMNSQAQKKVLPFGSIPHAVSGISIAILRHWECGGTALGRACNGPDERITVPRYFFNVRNHVNTQDVEGADLADLATAKCEALKDISDILKARSDVVGNYWQKWSIEICDHNRKVVLVVPFSDN
jgi:hypothetical protein